MDKTALAAILRDRASKMMDEGPCDGPERQQTLDTAELLMVLARIVKGASVEAAFGAPGDWGYDTPIGAALARREQPAPPAPTGYPPIDECVRVIAGNLGKPVATVAAALLAQAQEMNLDATELVHTQYRSAVSPQTKEMNHA